MHEETSRRTTYVHLNFLLPLMCSQSNFNDIRNSHLDAVGARQNLRAGFCYLHEDPTEEMLEVDQGSFPLISERAWIQKAGKNLPYSLAITLGSWKLTMMETARIIARSLVLQRRRKRPFLYQVTGSKV